MSAGVLAITRNEWTHMNEPRLALKDPVDDGGETAAEELSSREARHDRN
jgi:hypothetical protein